MAVSWLVDTEKAVTILQEHLQASLDGVLSAVMQSSVLL